MAKIHVIGLSQLCSVESVKKLYAKSNSLSGQSNRLHCPRFLRQGDPKKNLA